MDRRTFLTTLPLTTLYAISALANIPKEYPPQAKPKRPHTPTLEKQSKLLSQAIMNLGDENSGAEFCEFIHYAIAVPRHTEDCKHETKDPRLYVMTSHNYLAFVINPSELVTKVWMDYNITGRPQATLFFPTEAQNVFDLIAGISRKTPEDLEKLVATNSGILKSCIRMHALTTRRAYDHERKTQKLDNDTITKEQELYRKYAEFALNQLL